MLALNDTLAKAFSIEVSPTTTGGITAFVVFEDGLSDTDKQHIIDWVEQLNQLHLFKAKLSNKIPTTFDSMVYNVVDRTVNTMCHTLNNINTRS